MDYNLPGSSVHGDSPGKNTGVRLSCPPPRDLPNPGLLHCRWILYQLSYPGSPIQCILTDQHEGTKEGVPRNKKSLSFSSHSPTYSQSDAVQASVSSHHPTIHWLSMIVRQHLHVVSTQSMFAELMLSDMKCNMITRNIENTCWMWIAYYW